MATAQLVLGKEESEVIELIQAKKNFLLSGGAGSGKTYSLVQITNYLLNNNPDTKIACITYTRSAKDEIQSRIVGKNLRISTIHDFLWDCIKPYNHALKDVLISLMNQKKTSPRGGETRIIKSSFNDNDIAPSSYFDEVEEINYKETRNISKGIISHDDVLVVANKLFEEYPKLRRIIQDRFQYIFIDEYQDTFEYVIDIFLNFFEKEKTIIGCFGDEMQAIYDGRIGTLNNYIANSDIYKVDKKENRRNPLSVINLANQLRTDGLQQEPSSDNNAPNMDKGKIISGDIKFFYTCSQSLSEEQIKDLLTKNYDWDFSNKNTKKTKELNLTHNLIAEKAGFKPLINVYGNDGIIDFRERIKKYIKDQEIMYDFSNMTFKQVICHLKKYINTKDLTSKKLTSELKKIEPTDAMSSFIESNKRLYAYALQLPYSQFIKSYIDKDLLLEEEQLDPIIKQLFNIQDMIEFYNSNSINEFLRLSEYKIKTINDKNRLKEIIESLTTRISQSIHETIEFADKHNIRKKNDILNSYIEKNAYLYKRISEIKFSVFQCYYQYYTDKTPFSTQHKIKGQEFDDVLVILDNGKWNKYNFDNLFTDMGTESVLKRTQKIFYVCCTRAKKRLAVFYREPRKEVICKAEQWFGKDSVIELSIQT